MRWFRLSTLPAHERLAALRMQALAWQPFEDKGCALALLGDQGLAVCWDRRAAREALEAAGIEEGRVLWQPEPLFVTPMDEGVRLVQGLDGVEAQCWESGQLRSSQWWAKAPDAQSWSHFLHASAQSAQDMPALEAAAVRARSWIPVIDPQGNAGQRDTERRLVLVCGMALALCFGLAGRQWIDLHLAERKLDERFAGLSQRADQQAQSRRQALDTAQQLRTYERWLSSPLPIDVMEHLRDSLAGTGAIVKMVDLHDQRLRVGLQAGPTVQRAALIRALGAGAWFRDVTEARAEDAVGLVVLDIRLDGLRAPVAASLADAAAAAAAPAPLLGATGAAVPPPATPSPSPVQLNPLPGGAQSVAARPAALPASTAARPPAKQAPGTPADFPPSSVFDAIPTSK
ncbi:hypothetical protein ACS5PK_19690 [Roseateles sp. DB2]|uniref:hypothetical protein n=1 Tax=Roseateles sp. DB2 TaxID=3453717 RepID=UPI003EECE744